MLNSADGNGSSMRRDVLTVTIIAITALVLGANLFMLFDDSPPGQVQGQTAPDFELPLFDSDEMVSVEKYRGQVIVIDFWATWCPPCREQMPILERIANDRELADEVVVLSVNTDPKTDDRGELVEAFLRDEEVSLATLMDTGQARRAYRITTIPTLVVVGPSGRVTHVSEGLHDEATIRRLIAEAGDGG